MGLSVRTIPLLLSSFVLFLSHLRDLASVALGPVLLQMGTIDTTQLSITFCAALLATVVTPLSHRVGLGRRPPAPVTASQHRRSVGRRNRLGSREARQTLRASPLSERRVVLDQPTQGMSLLEKARPAF